MWVMVLEAIYQKPNTSRPHPDHKVPQKTRIVYCKDANRTGEHPKRSFDFLGYTFRPRMAIGRHRKRFVSFMPAVSGKAAKRMRLEARRWRMHLRSDLELEEIAKWARPTLTGWEREQCATERVLIENLLGQHREPIKAFAHVGPPARQPHTR